MRNSKKLPALLIFFSLMYLTNNASAQDREIGVKMNGLDNFNLVYKKKKSEDKYIRYDLAFLNANLEGRSGITRFLSTVGFSAGVEKRKAINDKLKFAHGFIPGLFFDVAISNNVNNSSINTDVRLRPQLGYVLGVQYHFSDNFYLGIESIPNISASIGVDENRNYTYNLRTNISFNAVGVSAVYRF